MKEKGSKENRQDLTVRSKMAGTDAQSRAGGNTDKLCDVAPSKGGAQCPSPGSWVGQVLPLVTRNDKHDTAITGGYVRRVPATIPGPCHRSPGHTWRPHQVSPLTVSLKAQLIDQHSGGPSSQPGVEPGDTVALAKPGPGYSFVSRINSVALWTTGLWGRLFPRQQAQQARALSFQGKSGGGGGAPPPCSSAPMRV